VFALPAAALITVNGCAHVIGTLHGHNAYHAEAGMMTQLGYLR
jgi:hypothetical protein